MGKKTALTFISGLLSIAKLANAELIVFLITWNICVVIDLTALKWTTVKMRTIQ